MARTSVASLQIIEVLSTSHLLTATEIISELIKKDQKFNKTSVYRALEKLQADGIVCKETFGESEAKFELRSAHHDHAVCTNCEKILTVACKDDLQKNIPGFIADHHHTTIFGLCKECSED